MDKYSLRTVQPSKSRKSATRLREAKIWCSKCLGSSVDCRAHQP